VESGFDRRRIRAASRTQIKVSGPSAVWIGISPFAIPIINLLDEPLVIQVGQEPETWVSTNGLIRCHRGAWVYIPWPDPLIAAAV
jgi:hypothetical protein